MFSNENMIDQHVYDSVSLGDEVPPTVAVVEIHQEERPPSLPAPRKPARMKRREETDDDDDVPALKETLV